MLPTGFYTVVLHGTDRSNGIGWSHSRTDALMVNNNYIIH
jgi:hypothetical protein